MSERDDLSVRAEVLSKLADQLSEQLAVERKANEELRGILRDGPGTAGSARESACMAPIATTLAAVAVGMSLCAAVAASWIGPGATCGRSSMAVPIGASPAVTVAASRAWTAGMIETPVGQATEDDSLGCGPTVDTASARCFVERAVGRPTTQPLLRRLILAYGILGEHGQVVRIQQGYPPER